MMTSQSERILDRLAAHEGEWVPMPELAVAGSPTGHGFAIVHSRITDLRKRGYQIAHKNEREGTATHSYYKLLPIGSVSQLSSVSREKS